MVRRPFPAGAAERYESSVAHHYFVRFHMSLILAAVIASGVLASKGLLDLGVHSLRLRYPIAVLASYLIFLLLVRLWIWYVSIRGGISIGGGSSGSLNLDADGFGGGGTSFRGFGGGDAGGAGASDSWVPEAQAGLASQPAPAPASTSSASWLPKLDFNLDGDGDGWLVLALLAALVLAIVGAGGYLVYAAPHILPEAAWQALLATTLTRVSKEEHHNWMSGVLQSTWIPFAIVLALAAALGWEAHHHCPSASRLMDVFSCVAR